MQVVGDPSSSNYAAESSGVGSVVTAPGLLGADYSAAGEDFEPEGAAAFGPFVGLFDQDCADEEDERVAVAEDPDPNRYCANTTCLFSRTASSQGIGGGERERSAASRRRVRNART